MRIVVVVENYVPSRISPVEQTTHALADGVPRLATCLPLARALVSQNQVWENFHMEVEACTTLVQGKFNDVDVVPPSKPPAFCLV